MAGSLGKNGVLNSDIYRNFLKRSWLSAFFSTPFSFRPLSSYPPLTKLRFPYRLLLLSFGNTNEKGCLLRTSKLLMQLGSGTAAWLFFYVRTLFFSWASVLVPILWAQAVNAAACPGHSNQWSCLATRGADVVRLLLLSGSNCKMQAIAHSFKGNFMSLKLRVLEGLLICYLLIKVREGVVNG